MPIIISKEELLKQIKQQGYLNLSKKLGLGKVQFLEK